MIGDVAGAHRTLADDLQNTLRRPPLCEGKLHTCLCCGGEMNTPGFACKDAGQAYEAVPTEHVRSSLEVLFRRSLGPSSFGRKDTTISVFKGTRFTTSKGGRVDCGCGDRTVLWVSRVRHCAFTILGMRHFRLGADSVVSQETGIPQADQHRAHALMPALPQKKNCSISSDGSGSQNGLAYVVVGSSILYCVVMTTKSLGSVSGSARSVYKN